MAEKIEVSLSASQVLLVDEYCEADCEAKAADGQKHALRRMLLAAIPKALSDVRDLTFSLTGTRFQIVVSKATCSETLIATSKNKRILLDLLGMDLFVELANFNVADVRRHLREDAFESLVERGFDTRRLTIKPKAGE